MRQVAAERRAAGAPGDPRAAARALLEVVDADEPPLRVLFGSGTTDVVVGIYQQRLAEWEQWRDIANTAQGVRS